MIVNPFVQFVVFWIGLPTLLLLAVVALAHFHSGFGAHIKGMFTDDKGKPSYTRAASFIAEVAVIAWGTHVVWKTDKFPENSTFYGAICFIGSMYALERLPDILASIRGVTLKPAPTGDSPPTS